MFRFGWMLSFGDDCAVFEHGGSFDRGAANVNADPFAHSKNTPFYEKHHMIAHVAFRDLFPLFGSGKKDSCYFA